MQKKQIKQALEFYTFYPLLWIISWLPFWALYRISDLIFLFVSTFGYRRKTITSNLKKAFPEKDDNFIRKTRIKFYRHFCDLIVETIGLLNVKPERIVKRIEIVDLHLLNDAISRNKDIVVVIGHYGNWEWVPSINLMVNAAGCSVYRPLKNPFFDKFMVSLRSLFNTTNFPLKSTVKEIVKMKRDDKRFILGLISDQSPSKYELQFWTTFLTQRTPVILGPEKMSKLADAELFFWDMDKTARGKYSIKVVPYPGDIKTDPEFAPTKWHVKKLEEQIYRKPELWLWSHKRWKYQHLYDGQTFE